MRLLIMPCVVAAALLTACGNDSQPTRGTNVMVSPSVSDGTLDDEACAALARAHVRALFDLLNRGEAASVEELFPADDGGWRFQVVPQILETARWAKNHSIRDIRGQSGLSEVPSSDATSRSDIRDVVHRFSDLTVTMTTVEGGTAVDEFPSSASYAHRVFSAELRWEAAGQPLYDFGWESVEGGGKIAVDCETQLFTVVLMSPLIFAPTSS
jgi:hypothetical protein